MSAEPSIKDYVSKPALKNLVSFSYRELIKGINPR